MNPFAPSVQVPSFRHGLGAHSSTLSSQVGPENPGGHTHVNVPSPSVHVPPFLHGRAAHSSTLTQPSSTIVSQSSSSPLQISSEHMTPGPLVSPVLSPVAAPLASPLALPLDIPLDTPLP